MSSNAAEGTTTTPRARQLGQAITRGVVSLLPVVRTPSCGSWPECVRWQRRNEHMNHNASDDVLLAGHPRPCSKQIASTGRYESSVYVLYMYATSLMLLMKSPHPGQGGEEGAQRWRHRRQDGVKRSQSLSTRAESSPPVSRSGVQGRGGYSNVLLKYLVLLHYLHTIYILFAYYLHTICILPLRACCEGMARPSLCLNARSLNAPVRGTACGERSCPTGRARLAHRAAGER